MVYQLVLFQWGGLGKTRHVRAHGSQHSITTSAAVMRCTRQLSSLRVVQHVVLVKLTLSIYSREYGQYNSERKDNARHGAGIGFQL